MDYIYRDIEYYLNKTLSFRLSYVFIPIYKLYIIIVLRGKSQILIR